MPAGTRRWLHAQRPYRLIIGLSFALSLVAFEFFNFDTTRYALANLLGRESFMGIGWATVLAVAFCSIDFAGLLRLFVPDERNQMPAEVWYLMGAWLLGATLNAIMTWWAVSLALLERPLGNELLSRAQLLRMVPIFVASLVWLTRILFIGSLSVASGYFFADAAASKPPPAAPRRATRPQNRPKFTPTTDELPPFLTQPSPE